MADIKTVSVVTDLNGREAIYIDGVLNRREDTIYAADISDAAGDGPILFEHLNCEFEGEESNWPERLRDIPALSKW